jgi:hypothetical protein
MSGCNLPNPVCSLDQINAPYPGTSYIDPSLLSIRVDTILSNSQITSAISYLKTNNRYPQPLSFNASIQRQDADKVTEYKQKLIEFHRGIKAEYNYYDARYTFLMKYIMTELSKPESAGSGQMTVANATNKAIELNKRMNIIVQLLQGISKTLYDDIASKSTEINTINADINSKAEKIKQHANMFSKKMGDIELKKRMVEYTQEKARATDNLLSVYFVLNVFALTGLVYVYKAL